MKTLNKLLMSLCIVAFSAAGVFAGEPPQFLQKTYPEAAVDEAWADNGAVFNPEGALSARAKQLIALGVAAQIPCEYCVLAHTHQAEQAGATEQQIREAVAVGAQVRKWSTILNGHNYDMEQFKSELGIAD